MECSIFPSVTPVGLKHRRLCMPKEEAWHRNLRHSRQTAKGILAAPKLGLDIPEEAIAAAKFALIEHHATGADTMLSWAAQQKMQNRI